MDINEIRMRNYKALLLQFRARPEEASLAQHGMFTRFADHAGVSARYLSHINNGRKNIGEDLSRQLEAGFGLPHGWMDNDHEAENMVTDDAERQFLATAMKVFRVSPLEAQSVLLRYMAERMDMGKPTK